MYECFGNNTEGAAKDAVKIHVIGKFGTHIVLIFCKCNYVLPGTTVNPNL